MEDLADSKVYAMYVSGGGMGLGDRDYYLPDDARNKQVREAYKKLIVTQMRNAGYSKKDANRVMNNVMKIETALADSAWTREQSRNIPAMYNPRSFEQLKAMYPNVNWDRFFIETMGIKSPESVIVTELSSVAQANNLMGSLTDREIKDYYLWKYVSQAAGMLSDDFANAAFEFNKVVSGVQQQRPRWKRALGAAEGAMGEAVGQLYVERSRVVKAVYARPCREPAHRTRQAHHQPPLDERRHQAQRYQEAQRLHREDRLSRQVEGLQLDDNRPQVVLLREYAQRVDVAPEGRARQVGQARRQDRVGYDSSNSQRLL